MDYKSIFVFKQPSSKAATSPNEKYVSRKLRFFKNNSIPESEEKDKRNQNQLNEPTINLPPLKLNNSPSINGEIASPTSQSSSEKGLDLSLLRYKARLVKSSRLMARRLLPSRHRNSNRANRNSFQKQQVLW